MSRVVLTFKNNEKEKSIEKFLEDKVSASAYIKELVWEDMNRKGIAIDNRTIIKEFDTSNEDSNNPFANFDLQIDDE